jgi:hypothetical protein
MSKIRNFSRGWNILLRRFFMAQTLWTTVLFYNDFVDKKDNSKIIDLEMCNLSLSAGNIIWPTEFK